MILLGDLLGIFNNTVYDIWNKYLFMWSAWINIPLKGNVFCDLSNMYEFVLKIKYQTHVDVFTDNDSDYHHDSPPVISMQHCIDMYIVRSK